jgi:membrane protease YdiL (CAAX protease family)
LPLWIFVAFSVAQLIVFGVILALNRLGIYTPSEEDAVFSTVYAAVVYAFTLLLTIGVPYLLKRRTTRVDVGLTRLPSWMDIILTPAGAVIYLVVSGTFSAIAMGLFPGLDLNQAQDVGFKTITMQYQYVLAFLTLIVVAPLAEEILFRGYLYGKLRKHVPLWLAVLVTSALFGAVHGQWNVAIDTFALSLVLCALRETTGSIWAGVLLHMLKNGIAFYFLFINPSFLSTLGG